MFPFLHHQMLCAPKPTSLTRGRACSEQRAVAVHPFVSLTKLSLVAGEGGGIHTHLMSWIKSPRKAIPLICGGLREANSFRGCLIQTQPPPTRSGWCPECFPCCRGLINICWVTDWRACHLSRFSQWVGWRRRRQVYSICRWHKPGRERWGGSSMFKKSVTSWQNRAKSARRNLTIGFQNSVVITWNGACFDGISCGVLVDHKAKRSQTNAAIFKHIVANMSL